jgi:hypothetical protein
LGAPAVRLAMRTQHAMEGGLAGDVDPLVGQRRNDLRRRRLGKTWFVDHPDDPRPFLLAQSVRRDRAIGLCSAIAVRDALPNLPTLQRAKVRTDQRQAGASRARSLRNCVMSRSRSWRSSRRVIRSRSRGRPPFVQVDASVTEQRIGVAPRARAVRSAAAQSAIAGITVQIGSTQMTGQTTGYTALPLKKESRRKRLERDGFILAGEITTCHRPPWVGVDWRRGASGPCRARIASQRRPGERHRG